MGVISHARVYIIMQDGKRWNEGSGMYTEHYFNSSTHIENTTFLCTGHRWRSALGGHICYPSLYRSIYLSVCIIVKYIQRNLNFRVFAIQIGRSFTYIVVVMY